MKIALTLVFLSCSFISYSQSDDTIALDKLWDKISQTVNTGDFEGYSALFHEDAILVSSTNPENSRAILISEALINWEQSFIDVKSGKMKAGAEFRFSERIISTSAANEIGIFKFSSTDSNGDTQIAYVHFEALSIKKNGQWLMIMEKQKALASEKEWETLK
ncbi:hypothetical protein [Fulvivirga sp.]|uniref:hypothetical protein n=1 Tax=Fulvivirga sp. TaxID=1931237 RepID=UPI0032EEB283